MSMGDGKAKNVLEYLDNLIEKGKATKGAIAPLKVAFTQVVRIVDGENWEVTDVKGIDVEDYMARFANLTMGKYSSDSLTVYKSRVNKVVSWYTQFLDKPGWTPDVQKRNRAPKATVSDKQKVKPSQVPTMPNQALSQPESPQSMPEIANAPGRVLYPYPLTDGQLIHISLPVRLLKDDARRIATFIESIAIDPPTQEGK
ncbi:MAG TPA: hypothetical protein VFT53_02590 [Candidatus Saccharimonadales bacterium]|nr:hypothetical protein [Candidatus Saccharimonadales bacterium]